MRRMLPLLVAALALVAASTGSATNTWSDRSGDSGTAPDITSVQVSNSDDNTTVTFSIAVHLRPSTWIGTIVAPVEGNREIDQPHQIVVAMDAAGGVTTTLYEFYSRRVLAGIPTQSGMSSDVVQFSVAAQPLGIHNALEFRITSSDLMTGNADQVPDGSGAIYYGFSAPPPPVVVKPVIAKPTTVPKRVVAGKRTTVSFRVTRSDTGEVLREGRMTAADPSIAGRILRHTEVWGPPVVRVSFVVPKRARGKQLEVTLTIALGEQSATRVASFRIR